jgi:DNA-binding SARP family transcriptional activator
MARLRMCLLGGFEPRLDEAPATWRLPRKVSGLLAYLAMRRGRPCPRGGLGAMLWGGSRADEARHSVRQALLSTRQALSGAGCADALVAEGDTLALDPAFVDVDVLEFEDRLDQGTVDALEHAAALYRGEFLDGFRLGEPAFDEWAAGERDRLRDRARHGLDGLLVHHDDAGAVEPAIETALRLLRVDRTQENVHRTLIKLYDRIGRRADAIRQYRACVGMLRGELGVEPAPETVRLYREILRPHTQPRGPVPEA